MVRCRGRAPARPAPPLVAGRAGADRAGCEPPDRDELVSGWSTRPRRDEAGAGLGLAIARGLVQAHHGTIAARNDGPGCRFEVRLPLAPADRGGMA
ncbi:ATP-binding protein [Saccharopolyspora sp. ASAGF58]|uniref:ATP-binding protein n=1 Tax=Saccharopolyspora sp. ASAGF58 TaxID=2719023 RepID=UPI00352FFFFC